jgi:hypothetical protein
LEPEYTLEVLEKHEDRVLRNQSQQQRLQTARLAQQAALFLSARSGDLDAPMKLAILENEIEEAKYSKTAIVINATSEGTAFAQRGGRDGNKQQESFDTKYWKDKECYHCNKKGHPATHCPDRKTKTKTKNSTSNSTTRSNNDESSRSSKSSKASITKMQKKMKKSFATLQSKIDELEHKNSDLTDSDSDEEEASHFQFSNSMTDCLLQGVQSKKKAVPHGSPGVPQETGTMFHQAFERRNAEVLFKQNHGKGISLDLRNIILLDSQSTIWIYSATQSSYTISTERATK